MKNLLERMCEKVQASDASFELRSEDPDDHGRYSFMQLSTGKARLIYGIRVSTGDCVTAQKKAELIAVFANKVVYIFNYFIFPSNAWPSRNPIPDSAILASDEVTRLSEKLKTEMFQEFYDGLDTSKLGDRSKNPWELEEEARKEAFSGSAPPIEPTVDFGANHLIAILCGEKTLEDCSKKMFKEEVWLAAKARRELISKLAETASISLWERTLYNALQNLDAKYVTATFEMSGSQGSEKIDPGKIMEKLIDNDDFSYWDFAVSKHGEQLMKKLCPARERLTCEHIVKITYGKKTIYER